MSGNAKVYLIENVSVLALKQRCKPDQEIKFINGIPTILRKPLHKRFLLKVLTSIPSLAR